MNRKALSVMTATSLVWWNCGHAEMMGCLIEPDRVADVGTQTSGVLASVHVERGDAVAAGQVMARLSAQVEKASVSVAEVKARAEAEALQAQAAYELAQRKLERTRDLVKRDFVSDQALDQSEAEARVAQQRVEQAREAQRVAHREYMLSNAQLGQRDVRSPFAGLVIERYRTEGERIEHEPVVRVARIDPLRIEAIVPAAQFGQIKSGQQATVKTDLPEFPALAAQVTLVDRVIDPASNSFRVRLMVPNPGNRIPSGLRCKIAFDGGDTTRSRNPSAPAAVAPSAAAPAPATAGVPERARWQQGEAMDSPRVMVVKLTTPPIRPFIGVDKAALQPAQFVSSTLKFAMAELARTSPGARIIERTLEPRQISVKQWLARTPLQMAMSTQLPMKPATAPVMAFNGPMRHVTVVAAVKPVESKPLLDKPQSRTETGVRLASAR